VKGRTRAPSDKRRIKTIDDYLDGLGPEQRAALQKLRRTIRSIAPKVEECISYSMPAFRLDGHVIAGFMARSKGCSYYPFSGRTLSSLTQDIAAYSHTKSALHFDPARGLPVTLVRRLLRARIAETTTQNPSRPRRKISR
jgi:uncharacterized protein YdhG (YjbR/CyaY superfamily)